jgi:CheY-like chemotaxis protein
MESQFENIALRVPAKRFENWEHYMREAPEYSIGLEVIDDAPGHRGHYVHFDHHFGVIREVTMSAAMQAYIAVRQGRLMERWLRRRRPVPVYVWNADQDVCLAAFVLEYHELLERAEGEPLLRWIVQYNNKIDVCGGLYPVNLDELVKNHFTWVFEPYRQQRIRGKTQGDEALVKETIRQVCDRLLDLLEGRAGTAPITAKPEILYTSPHNFVIADEKGDPNSRLVLAAQGHTNLISLVCARPNGRYTYSVIRGSPYDEDVFQVTELIRAFQAAEDLPDAKIWGGSNLAAGSDSELGSSLHWTRLRDIAEPVVQEARLKSVDAVTSVERTDDGAPRVLVVMPAEKRAQLQEPLAECGGEMVAAESCAEACEVLRTDLAVDAIFSALILPDGSFARLVQVARQRRKFIPIVVCLPQVDGGWIDLLEAGAFGLLVEPYERKQIQDVITAITAQGRRPLASS